MRARTFLLASLSAAIAVASAAGSGVAASSSVVVSLSVPSATNVGVGACAAGTAGVTNFGTTLPGTSQLSSVDCAVTFGSSNDAAMLTVHQPDGSGVAMWRLPTGALDATFGGGDGIAELDHPGGGDNVYDVAVGSDGKPTTVGETCGTCSIATTRFTTAGAPDTSYSVDGMQDSAPNVDSVGAGVAVQPDGKVVVVGYTSPGNRDSIIQRYRTDGTLDPSFGVGGSRIVATSATTNDEFLAVRVQPDGRIVVSGWRTNGAQHETTVARFTSDGNLDTTFAGTGWLGADLDPGPEWGEVVLPRDDGSIIVVGRSSNGAGRYGMRATR
jgi:uncharacterized delta-60 repeat protein